MPVPDMKLAYRALGEGELDAEAFQRLTKILSQYQRGDLSVTCAEILMQEFGIPPEKIRSWEKEQNPNYQSRIGKYRLKRRVGQGGMGVVFEAQHPNIPRPVALKILTPKHRRPEDWQRFLREVKSAGLFNHPSIVHAYDAGIDGDIPFLVMEFVEGENLFQILMRSGPFDLELAYRCLGQATSALWFLESCGWTHGDGKPSNWILTPQQTLKLVDLGLCRPPGIPRDPELVHGSPPYMAPEQFSRDERIDIRSDLFALGGTFYHLLTGRPPYLARTVAELYRVQKRDSVPALRSLRPEVPGQFEAIIMKLLEPAPERRFESCEELAKALREFDPGIEIIDPPASIESGSSSEPERRRLRLPVALVIVGVLFGVALLAYPLLFPAFDRDSDSVPVVVEKTPEPKATDDSELTKTPGPEGAEDGPTWESLWSQPERPYPALFTWLDENPEHPELAARRQLASNEFKREATESWRDCQARAAALEEEGLYVDALTALARFPERLQIANYADSVRQNRDRLEEARHRAALELAIGLGRALQSGNYPRASRIWGRGVRVGAIGRSSFEELVRKQLGSESLEVELERWYAATPVSAYEVAKRRSEIRTEYHAQTPVTPDWLHLARDPLTEVVALLLFKEPELSGLDDRRLLEGLFDRGLLTQLPFEVVAALYRLLEFDPTSLEDEIEAARMYEALFGAAQAQSVEEFESYRARIEAKRFEGCIVAQRWSRESQRVRGWVERNRHLGRLQKEFEVVSQWNEAPRLECVFGSEVTLIDWRFRPNRWRVEAAGLSPDSSDGLEVIEFRLPLEGEIEVLLDLSFSTPNWRTVVSYGPLAVALKRRENGEVAIATASSEREAFSKLEEPAARINLEAGISQQNRITMSFGQESIAVSVDGQRRVVDRVDASLRNWLVIGLPNSATLKRVVLSGHIPISYLRARNGDGVRR